MNKLEISKFLEPFTEKIELVVWMDGKRIPIDKAVYEMDTDGNGRIVLKPSIAHVGKPPALEIFEENLPKENLPKASIFVDGSCIGNPGPGGWAFIIQTGEKSTLQFGSVKDDTTNNRMELCAAISALANIPEPHSINLYTDSQYLVKGMKGEHKKASNFDLWKLLDRYNKCHKINWLQIRRNGLPELVECDKMAREAAYAGSR